MDRLGAGVLVLALAGDRHADDVGRRALAAQVDGRELHGLAAAGVGIDPFDGAVRVRVRTLGHEVVDVVGPVLDRRIANLGARQRDDLDHRRVEAVRGVDRSRAALDVMDLGALVDDDQRPLELPGVLTVDAEVGLQRERDLDALGHVHERAAGPDRAVERGELVVLGRDDGAEVLLEDLGVFLERLIGAHEYDTDLAQLLADAVVDDLGVVLRADAGEELALRLGDAELLERRLDLLGDVVPRLLFALGRLAVVDDLVEVDAIQAVGPVGHGPLKEMLVGAQPELEHPVGLFLEPADLLDRLAGQAALGLAQVDDVVVEGELVALVGDDLAGGGHAISGPRVRRARVGWRSQAGSGDLAGNSESDYRD